MTDRELMQQALMALEEGLTSNQWRELSAALRDRLAQPEQEPVAWMMPDGKTVDKWALQFYGGQVGKPLYTTPPQRTWVGLTDEEVDALQDFAYADDVEFIRHIEAKLKEKNGG